METIEQRCLRLVMALEQLADEEWASVHSGNYAAVRGIQDRAAPLVAALVKHGDDVRDGVLRRRIQDLATKRSATLARISANVRETREKIDALEASSRRVSRVAPAYGGTSTRHRFVVSG